MAGYKFYDWYKQHLPNIELPVMCLAMIAGVILQTILNHTPFRDSVDEHVEGRIGSMVTDYLVGFGVASISIYSSYGVCGSHCFAVHPGYAYLADPGVCSRA